MKSGRMNCCGGGVRGWLLSVCRWDKWLDASGLPSMPGSFDEFLFKSSCERDVKTKRSYSMDVGVVSLAQPVLCSLLPSDPATPANHTSYNSCTCTGTTLS
jgi:hypothetical protein